MLLPHAHTGMPADVAHMNMIRYSALRRVAAQNERPPMPESTTNPKLIAGRDIARHVEQTATAGAETLANRGIAPTLAVVYRGEHADAASYRRIIEQRAARVGVALRTMALPEDAPLETLEQTVAALNADAAVHGVLVQNPLPTDQRRLVSERLAAHKDVEGLTAVNLGRLILDQAPVLPCTPAAIALLIESRVSEVKSMRVVIINRSAIVGRPLSQILLSKPATETVCSTATVDLPAEARRAEILVVAIGRPRALGPDYIGEGAV